MYGSPLHWAPHAHAHAHANIYKPYTETLGKVNNTEEEEKKDFLKYQLTSFVLPCQQVS